MDRLERTLATPGDTLAVRWPLTRLSWLVVFSALISVLAHAPILQAAPFRSVRAGVPFVFSDFDGDRRADLAVVQAGRSELPFMEYWVHLELSAVGARTIHVSGPVGGLQITSRDVNGNHFPDLILTAAWSNKLVAIFLNDGHGSFSRVDDSVYSEDVFSIGSSPSWTSSSFSECHLLIAPSQTSSSICLTATRQLFVDFSRRAARRSDDGFLVNWNLASHFGRAPPSGLRTF